MTNILIGSEYIAKLYRDLKWNVKWWATRDGRAQVYWALTDAEPPSGFVLDDRYTWNGPGGKILSAYFSAEVLTEWHSEYRGIGKLSARPVIEYTPIVKSDRERMEENLRKLTAQEPAYSAPTTESNRAEALAYDGHNRNVRAIRTAYASARQRIRREHGLPPADLTELPVDLSAMQVNVKLKLNKDAIKAAKAERREHDIMMDNLAEESRRFRQALAAVCEFHNIRPAYPTMIQPGTELTYIPRAAPRRMVIDGNNGLSLK